MNKEDVLDYVCDKDAKEIIKKALKNNDLDVLYNIIRDKMKRTNEEIFRINSMGYMTNFMRDKYMQLKGEYSAYANVVACIDELQYKEGDADE